MERLIDQINSADANSLEGNSLLSVREDMIPYLTAEVREDLDLDVFGDITIKDIENYLSFRVITHSPKRYSEDFILYSRSGL